MKRDVGIAYIAMRKIHYNVMRFRDTVSLDEAEVLAGRCGIDLDLDIKDEDTVGYEISKVHRDDLCCNCQYKATYGHRNKIRDTKYENKINGNAISDVTDILEYILACIECDHQTAYGYLSFAIQDGREHVLTSGHKLVTISEIIWEEDKVLEIIQIDIKLVYDD